MNITAIYAGIGIAVLSAMGLRFGSVKFGGASGSLAAVLVVLGIFT